MRREIVRVGVGAALLLATGWVHAQMPVAPRASSGELFVPRPEVARATALGFDAVLADYYWLQAVQTVGGSAHPSERGPLLGSLIDVVTTLDPWVDHPYRFAAVWMTDSPQSVRKANELLSRGIEHHPDDWRNHFYLGFNHFMYLGEPTEAADALERAIALPDSPRYLKRLVARLRSAGGELDVAETFLTQILMDEADPFGRAQLEQALDEIATERRARVLDKARDVYRERFERDIEVVEDLYAVMRRLPEEPHGWEWELGEDGRIVSTYLGHRYEPILDGVTRKQIEEFQERGAPAPAEAEGA